GDLAALILQVHNEQITMGLRGQQVGTAQLPSGDCTINFHSDGLNTTAQEGQKPLVSMHNEVRRPQLTGIYSDLNDKVDYVKGLSFQARVDNRWESYATAFKIGAMALAVTAFLGCVVALRRLDVRAGRRPPRLAPRGWWKPTLRDVAVYATLLVW